MELKRKIDKATKNRNQFQKGCNFEESKPTTDKDDALAWTQAWTVSRKWEEHSGNGEEHGRRHGQPAGHEERA